MNKLLIGALIVGGALLVMNNSKASDDASIFGAGSGGYSFPLETSSPNYDGTQPIIIIEAMKTTENIVSTPTKKSGSSGGVSYSAFTPVITADKSSGSYGIMPYKMQLNNTPDIKKIINQPKGNLTSTSPLKNNPY